jgi:hypothetical protein
MIYVVTHPVYEKDYDCSKFQIIEGEKRWHQKGDKDDCPTCERYRKNFRD